MSSHIERDNFSTPEQPSYLIQFLYRVSSNPNDAAIATADLSSDATRQHETKTRVVPAWFSMQSVRQPRSPWWHDVRPSPSLFNSIPFQARFPWPLAKNPLDSNEERKIPLSNILYFFLLSIIVQSNQDRYYRQKSNFCFDSKYEQSLKRLFTLYFSPLFIFLLSEQSERLINF